MFDLSAVQAALRDQHLDGWLLYDFRGLNVLARRVVDLPPDKMFSRRWFYFVPANGEPRKLVHRIETNALDHLPGSARVYLRWQELEAGVQAILGGAKKVALEYTPRNGNPYVSRMDGGTLELVRSFGVEPISSGDLIQLFEACWDADQERMHFEAAVHTRAAFEVAFDFIRDGVKNRGGVRESEVIARILAHFKEHGLVTDHDPIVGAGPHGGDPHYSTKPDTDTLIKEGEFVLIDLWAKLDRPRSVYSDLTRTCFVGPEVPEPFTKVFDIVAAGRDAAIAFVQDAFAAQRPIQGWQVDDACRRPIEQAGYGEFFCHRTGHSIGQETHGNGANMDNLETRDERRILPRTCFSIEPGIYLPEFGVRSEVNVYIDAGGQVHVTGGEPQTAVTPLFG